MKAYYHARAREYDDWWRGRGLFAARERPGWPEEVHELERRLAELTPARTLDVACGTGFLTRHLRGVVVGLDQSPSMVALAQRRLPDGVAMVGDAFALPFADRAFERVALHERRVRHPRAGHLEHPGALVQPRDLARQVAREEAGAARDVQGAPGREFGDPGLELLAVLVPPGAVPVGV